MLVAELNQPWDRPSGKGSLSWDKATKPHGRGMAHLLQDRARLGWGGKSGATGHRLGLGLLQRGGGSTWQSAAALTLGRMEAQHWPPLCSA